MAYARLQSARLRRARYVDQQGANGMFWRWSAPLILAASICGCASAPTGPSVMVLPGLGKSFEQFNADDAVCRQWGLQATGRTPVQPVTGDSETAPGGAAVAAGAGGTTYSGQEGQWRYDMAYQQCMYSRGHQIPGVPAGRSGSAPVPQPGITPKPVDSSSIPPPPPGPPPPPPPGITR